MREWRNGRRAGFRHQFRKSEGSTPFSRTTKSDTDSLKISVAFILRLCHNKWLIFDEK